MARSAPLAWFGEDVFYSPPMILGKYKAVTLDPASLCIKRMSMVFMLWGKRAISTYCIFIVSFLMTVLFASSRGATLMLALMPWFIVLHS